MTAISIISTNDGPLFLSDKGNLPGPLASGEGDEEAEGRGLLLGRF